MIEGRIPLSEVITGLGDLDDPDAPGRVTRIEVQTPVELGLVVEGGHVTSLSGTPPTQTVRTSVLPVWHHLRVTVVAP
jgi:hypothetical protein